MSTADPLRRAHLAAPPRTLVDVLAETVARHPDASAIDDGTEALSYRELAAAVERGAAELRAAGVCPGDRVGIRAPSGTRQLYLSILSVLAAGAAYVPVDADDPDERARLVFGEAGVVGVIGSGGAYAARERSDPPVEPRQQVEPTPEDDAWIIFTSGSTGTPKGVAVTHRSAAAFVDAESRLFLQQEPLGPADRVLAGLSVAFDASCEEMWLAWASGACLVPAPRSLVRTGADLGPWLVARGVTAVSTVPTLAALWAPETLENVRLLIFGGEACPPELAARLAVPGREVWNTYGPTEATVVACAALLGGDGVAHIDPVRIGLPLDGWDLAVVGTGDGPDAGREVAEGEVGELVIGGVGLARYLDPAKDAEKYAPMPSLGWDRAYRSGDLVRRDPEGLVFQGRADDQVKVGGRRIELGEIEAALQALPGVAAAAAAVRRSEAGMPLLVGYLAVAEPAAFDRKAAIARLREELPAALVPALALLDELPVRTSGKVDRAALPWPLAGSGETEDAADAERGELDRALAADWRAVLGAPTIDDRDSFFDLGGTSLAAAQLVSRVRTRYPEFTMAALYEHPRFGALAESLAAGEAGPAAPGAAAEPDADAHHIAPVPTRMQWLQTLISVPLFVINGVRWLTAALTASTLLRWAGGPAFLPEQPWWLLLVAIVLFVTPFGRMAIAVLCARLILAGLKPGDYPRGGGVHLRLWAAEQAAHLVGAASLAGAPWISLYARALGATVSRDVDLHTLPPITGLLHLGEGASVEPEVDLAGYWIDGDTVRIGAVRIGAGATVGARSTLLPGTRIGKHAEVAPGSSVFGRVPAGQLWAGSPAVRVGKARGWWPQERPPRRPAWVAAYAASSVLISLLPVVALVAGGLVVVVPVAGARTAGAAVGLAAAWLVPASLAAGLVLAGLTVLGTRLLGLGLKPGTFPVRSRVGWQSWSTERLLDLSRTVLFPLYSSLFTPVWLRLLGARVGRNVEASTVLLIPKMTEVRDGAFLADDTLVAPYELGGGWLRLTEVEIGRRAFLGNSGMATAGHRVPKNGLVAVLSAAPPKSKPGSSWLGSPAMRLQRAVAEVDDERTFNPPVRLRVARALWELGRVVPVVLSCGVGLAVLVVLCWLTVLLGPWLAALASGPVLILAGAVAAALAVAAKWALIGPIRPGEHPLWSSFIWRTEVSDTFVEMLAAPWFANAAAGSPALNVWLRALGVRIGRGVWCETYWLPEPDLVELADGVTVNRGCVVQTHLFHDRIMSMDAVVLESGSTLGPHGVALPASRLGANSTVGPASLVMRGERVPDGSRWSGNPIGPWREVSTSAYYEEPDEDATPAGAAG